MSRTDQPDLFGGTPMPALATLLRPELHQESGP